jgi:glycosyltransferase involved in cell wall biosynthesis
MQTFSGWIRQNGIDVLFAQGAWAYWQVAAARLAQRTSLWSIPNRTQQADTCRAIYPATQAGAFQAAYRVLFECYAMWAIFDNQNTNWNFSVVFPGIRDQGIRQYLSDWSPAEARQAIGCPPDKILISLAGAAAPKALQSFITAAGMILDSGRRDVLFCVAEQGNSRVASALAGLQKSYPDHIRRIPETHETRCYYRASDIGICATLNEAISAMAFGLPIVAIDAPGISERLTDKATALIAPAHKPRAIANNILDLLDHEARRKQMGAAALALFTIIGDFEAMVTDYETLLLEAFTTTGGEFAGSLESATRPQVAA